MPAVTFDPGAFSAMFPELASSVSAVQGAGLFLRAGLFFDNTATSRVTDPAKQLALMNLLVAHLAKIYLPINGAQPSGGIGRVASAGEGSVSVSFDLPSSPNAGWFAQTQYGLEFWQATAFLRSAIYIPGRPQRPFSWP